LEIEKYSTAIAVEHQEGFREGEMKGLIGEFVAAGKLSRKSLGGIKQNSPSEDRIRAVWVARDEEGLSDDGEEEEVPEGRTFDDFIAYLRAEGVIRKEEGE
jgi:hypothetical protein